jgi:hypothetical protein
MYRIPARYSNVSLFVNSQLNPYSIRATLVDSSYASPTRAEDSKLDPIFRSAFGFLDRRSTPSS